ncbi:MAG: hypothetical protein AAGA56_15305 [Myxococcota bacterium]
MRPRFAPADDEVTALVHHPENAAAEKHALPFRETATSPAQRDQIPSAPWSKTSAQPVPPLALDRFATTYELPTFRDVAPFDQHAAATQHQGNQRQDNQRRPLVEAPEVQATAPPRPHGGARPPLGSPVRTGGAPAGSAPPLVTRPPPRVGPAPATPAAVDPDRVADSVARTEEAARLGELARLRKKPPL